MALVVMLAVDVGRWFWTYRRWPLTLAVDARRRGACGKCGMNSRLLAYMLMWRRLWLCRVYGGLWVLC